MRADIMKYVIHFAKNEQKHILRVQKRSPRDEDYWNATFLRSIFKKSSVTKNMIRDPRSTSWSEMTVLRIIWFRSGLRRGFVNHLIGTWQEK